MAAQKRKTLPKDFGEIIRSGDVAAWEAMYEKCEIEAYYDRVEKYNALSYEGIDPKFIRWAVARGMDPSQEDRWGKFSIEHQCRNLENVAALIEAGADVNKKNCNGRTVLENILWHGTSGPIVEIVKLLLAAGAKTTQSAMIHCLQTSEDIIDDCGQYHGPEWVETATAELAEMYALFGMKPDNERRARRMAEKAERKAQQRKARHDGVSPIRVKATRWQDQFEELWNLLVPPSGHAPTVQGEVIRIAGKVTREILDNGACNWSRDYKKLPQALPGYLAQGNMLEAPLAEEAVRLSKGIGAESDEEELYRLSELVVTWVLRNPEPIAMPERVDYKR